MVVYSKIREVVFNNWHILLGSMVCFLLWILNAPDIRFGMGYLIVITSCLLSMLIVVFQKYKIKPILYVVVFSLMTFIIKSTRVSISESNFINKSNQ